MEGDEGEHKMALWRVAVLIDVEAPSDAHEDQLSELGLAEARAGHARTVWTSEAEARLWSREIGPVLDR